MSQKKHTMEDENLDKYCKSKEHDLFIKNKIKKVKIVPEYNRSAEVSDTEKNDKLFNFKRPTAKIVDDKGFLYVFPGKAYVEHYAKIYAKLGYKVEKGDVNSSIIRDAVLSIFPKNFPQVDIVILGYVEPLAMQGDWEGEGDIQWKIQSINGKVIAFVGVKFSYWGDIIYYIAEKFSNYCKDILYIGKLGSLNPEDKPNMTIATGNSSLVDGKIITWDNMFDDVNLVVFGKHYTLPSVLDETAEWFNENKNQYRFVDPEIGWIAKSAKDNNLNFSYLHLVTNNLNANYLKDLTNEREQNVLKKRYQYVGIIKSILHHVLGRNVSLTSAVMKAQQTRVDRGLMKPLKRDWKACLSFAYHTQEEAWEVVRELPRREWKDQEVIPENVLAELADTQIQLLTTLIYAGFSEEELEEAVLKKLQVKRKDWK